MILQALTDYYRTLEGQGQLSAPGWSPVKVSFALCIDQDGTLERVISLQTEQMKGKKTVWHRNPSFFPPQSSAQAVLRQISSVIIPAIYWEWTIRENRNAVQNALLPAKRCTRTF